MREKRLAQESRSPEASKPAFMTGAAGLGSLEVAPGIYTCCQCGAGVPIQEAFRRSDAVSFGSLFCMTCAQEVARCYNLPVSQVVLRPEERLNMLVDSGVRGKDVPPLQTLGFMGADPAISDAEIAPCIVEVDDNVVIELD